MCSLSYIQVKYMLYISYSDLIHAIFPLYRSNVSFCHIQVKYMWSVPCTGQIFAILPLYRSNTFHLSLVHVKYIPSDPCTSQIHAIFPVYRSNTCYLSLVHVNTCHLSFVWGPYAKCVDWRQYATVMQREVVTVMPSCSGGGNVVVVWSLSL
jgi:hypothetical protein